MRYLMNLINLKMVSSVAVAVGIAVCLVPQSAQAGFFKFSGSPNGGLNNFIFNLNTSVTDSNLDPKEGLFEGAVQDAKYTCTTALNSFYISFCGGKTEVAFQTGDFKASPITSLNDITDYPVGSSNSYIGGVKYEARLNSSINPSDFADFGILVQPRPSYLINSLSELENEFVNIYSSLYLGVRSVNSQNGSFSRSGGRFTAISVPEPDTIGSLLSITVGALLLMKRKNRSKKLAQSRLILSK